MMTSFLFKPMMAIPSFLRYAIELNPLIAAALILTPALVGAAPMCGKDFSAFIEQLQISEEFQELHTRFPLSYSHIDHEDPMLKMKTLHFDRVELKNYERYPSAEYQTKLNIVRILKPLSKNSCEVQLSVADSDIYAITFIFNRHKGSWQLVSVRDDAL